MHNFKVGDKVKLKPGRTGYAVDRSKQSWVIVDSLPTALELDTKTLSIHSKYVTNYANDFELVGDVPMFDMYTNSWFIKIANEEEYNAAEACSVSDVVWPADTNAEAKRLLGELQSQIAELQEKAENLQKTMK